MTLRYGRITIEWEDEGAGPTLFITGHYGAKPGHSIPIEDVVRVDAEMGLDEDGFIQVSIQAASNYLPGNVNEQVMEGRMTPESFATVRDEWKKQEKALDLKR